MKQLDFLSVGEVLMDMTPVELASGERAFLPKVGGAPVNAACAAARLGASAAFVGLVDSGGRFAQNTGGGIGTLRSA